MAIAVIDSKHFTCLSGDTKPTIVTRSDVEAGDFITETDTGKVFITYNGTDWIEYSAVDTSAGDAANALNAAMPANPTALSANAMLKGQLAYLAPVTSSADTTHFVSSQLIGLGNDYFVGWTAYVSWDAGGGSAAPQGEYRTITDYVSTTGTFTLGAAATQLSASDIILVIHPMIAALGLIGDTAATGAVTATDTAMAYIKQLVTNSEAVAAVLGAVDTAAATGAVTATDLLMAYVKQLVTLLIETQADADYAEEHQHHKTIWYGKKSDQTTYWCDVNSLTPYRAISGSAAYGSDASDEAQLFSASDTLSEIGTGLVCGDFDQILIVANSSDTIYKCRLVWGTGTLAAAVSAGQYSEFMYIRKSTDTVRLPREIKCPKIPVNNKVWLQCLNASDNATIDFYIGVHAYDF